MKITIPRCATWPPRFWDTTNPVRRAEAEAWVRSLVAEDGPGSPESDERATEAPTDHPNTYSVIQGVKRYAVVLDPRVVRSDQWPPPKPGTHETQVGYPEGVGALPGEDRGRGGAATAQEAE